MVYDGGKIPRKAVFICSHPNQAVVYGTFTRSGIVMGDGRREIDNQNGEFRAVAVETMRRVVKECRPGSEDQIDAKARD